LAGGIRREGVEAEGHVKAAVAFSFYPFSAGAPTGQ
jgi:hypothetical protein